MGIAAYYGVLYVADRANNRIEKFDTGGAFIRAWGGAGTQAGQFDWPIDLAVDVAGVAVGPDGTIYVSDFSLNRVQKFDAAGHYLGGWGATGTARGMFDGVAGIAISGGIVSCADSGNNRIEAFDTNGSVIAQWGELGESPVQFHAPAGIAVDAGGSVFVTDAYNSRVQKFDVVTSVVPMTWSQLKSLWR